MLLEKGRVCLKIAGREAGKYCVVVEAVDDSFAMVTGPKAITRIKRRKCNVDHLEPTEEKLDVGAGADSDVEKAWRSSGLIEKLGIEIPKFRQKKA